MCILHITFKASVSICMWPQKDGRWQIGPKLRKVPFRVTPDQGSDVTAASAAGSSRALTHPISDADLLPQATAAAIEEENVPEASAEENNEGYLAGMTEKLITVSGLPQR